MDARRAWAAFVIAVTLGVGVILGTLMSNHVRAAHFFTGAPGASPLPPPSPVQLSNSFTRVAAQVSPAVVFIRTETTMDMTRQGSGKPGQNQDGIPFHHFFPFGPEGSPSRLSQRSLGSGVILDRAGYILTNYHVVMRDDQPRAADRVEVQLGDDGSESYKAKLIGYDKWTDLAVIRIDTGKSLPVAPLGDSDAVNVGDWVLAIGSPFGLSATVTAGIISAKGRDIDPGTEGEFKRFLQTDAAINPGNSGGPLVNMAGQVIGINTAIATNRGVYDGVGFAIPSTLARKVYNSLISTGTVRRGAIGVTFNNVKNSSMLRSFGTDRGVVVQSVEPGSPADRGGLRPGDVITAIQSKPVDSGEALLGIISNTDPGSRVRVDYLRNGHAASATLIVGDWNQIVAQAEDEGEPGPAGQAPKQSSAGDPLGVEVKPVAAAEAHDLIEQLRLDHQVGVWVADVTPGSFGEDLGLRPYDVILKVNHKEILSIDDFNRVNSGLKSGQDVLILIARRNGRNYTTLFLADRLP